MKIIAFCGIDGSGKSTQIRRVSDVLTLKGYKVYISKVFYYPFFHFKDDILDDFLLRINMGFEFAKHYMTLLPVLKEQNYDYVLCDRFTLCHMAFSKTYGLDETQLKTVYRLYSLVSEPDITLFFDVPCNIALERIHSRKEKAVCADETYEIISKTIDNYHYLIDKNLFFNKKPVVIDATSSEQDITNEVLKLLI